MAIKTAPIVGVLCAVLAATVIAQDVIPLDRVIKSQRGTVTQKIANTDISIEYGRPVARGRELYGSLVPYGRIWHPGANDATSMTVGRITLTPSTVATRPAGPGVSSVAPVPRRLSMKPP